MRIINLGRRPGLPIPLTYTWSDVHDVQLRKLLARVLWDARARYHALMDLSEPSLCRQWRDELRAYRIGAITAVEAVEEMQRKQAEWRRALRHTRELKRSANHEARLNGGRP